MTRGSQLCKHGGWGEQQTSRMLCSEVYSERNTCGSKEKCERQMAKKKLERHRKVEVRLMVSMHDFISSVMSGEENKATLLELGAVEPVTKLLTHEDKTVRRNATMIFGILSSNSKYQLLKLIK